MFEPVWDRNSIACVQITMAEDFGVADRGSFYDPVGALQDVVVNHLMQVVAATAMEPPASRDARALKDAMFGVFAAMPPGRPGALRRGQYEGYREIKGVAKDSTHGDLRGGALRDRQLALERGPVLHPHRQGSPGRRSGSCG